MTKLVVLDKDGTVIAFDEQWMDACYELIDLFIEQFNPIVSKETILKEMGIVDRQFIGGGVLSVGTTRELINCFETYADGDIESWLVNVLAYLNDKYMQDLPMIPGTREVLNDLKKRGFLIALVTADDSGPTEKFLSQNDIHDYFDFVITSDKQAYHKPDPRVLDDIFKIVQIDSENIIVVGDSTKDIHLGLNLNARQTIGVLSGTSMREDLHEADLVIEDINQLLDVIEIN